MSIINKYILRSHLAPFLFGTILVMFLFLFQFLLNNLDKLVGKGLSYWVILQLIGLNLSWMLVLAVPMGVLFSTLMTFGNMSAIHEITIIKTSGGSLIKMMKPILLASIVLTIFLYWFNEQILPEANHRAKVLMMDIQRKKPTFSLESSKFSQELNGFTILARKVDSLRGTLRAVTIYDTRNSNQTNIISADSGIASFSYDMSKLILNLFNGEIHQFTPNSLKNYRIVKFKKYRVMTDASGFSLTRTNEDLISRGDREMHIKDMQKIVDEARKKEKEYAAKIYDRFQKHYNYLVGLKTDTTDDKRFKTKTGDTSYASVLVRVEKRTSFLRSTISSNLLRENDYNARARQYIVEIQKKYAIPFACFVFIFVGCPLGIMTKGGNFGISAAISIGFYILYWACLIGGEKLADRGFLNPVLSMWLGNIIIFLMGIILVIKVNNESLSFPGEKLFKKIFGKSTEIEQAT